MATFYTPSKISENIRETPEGFLLCLCVPIARTGEMIYGDGETPLETEDGKVVISRDAKEVFNADTISSFSGKAVTIKHPEEFVNPKNWSTLAKGMIQNVRKAPDKDEDGEESLIADLLITDALAIQLIRAGLREVSCGYEAEYEQTGKGTGRQTNIIGNHLALVEEGRAGQSYAINDHKGKGTMNKLAEQMKKLFGKAVDEAVAGEEKKSEDEDKKEEGKVTDKEAYDELVKMVKDLGEKIESMNKPKDEAPMEKKSQDDEEKKPEEKKSEDAEGNEAEMKMEERLKALEVAVAKLLDMEKGESEDEDEEGDEDSDESEDEDEEEVKKKTGDSKRKTGLENTKNAKAFDQSSEHQSAVMTAEKLNEINAAHWARK